MFTKNLRLTPSLLPQVHYGGMFSGASGGGSAGDVNYPEHMREQHHEWLNDQSADPDYTMHVADEMDRASTVGGTISEASPFNAETAYDPSTDLAAIQTQHDALQVIVDALDPNADVQQAVVQATSQYDNSVNPNSKIVTAVGNFEARAITGYKRSVSRATAGMFDIMAVMNSQTPMMLANMEAELQGQIDTFEGGLRMQADFQRSQGIVALTVSMMSAQAVQLQAEVSVFGGQQDVSRLKILASQDQKTQDMEWEVRDALWDLDLFAYGNNVLASISGAAVVPRAQTPGERFFSNFNSSVSAGFNAGTIGGPAVGAAVTVMSFLAGSIGNIGKS